MVSLNLMFHSTFYLFIYLFYILFVYKKAGPNIINTKILFSPKLNLYEKCGINHGHDGCGVCHWHHHHCCQDGSGENQTCII